MTPDVETASEGYAGRFRSPVGQWLLSVQEQGVRRLLEACGSGPLDVLEIGGGHGQLTELFLSAGHRVTVQGSSASSLARHQSLRARYPGQLRLLVSRLWKLPCADSSFDLAVGVRLLAHVVNWRELLDEMARVSRRNVLLDYAPMSSFNMLPFSFRAKRLIERNTRPYFCHWARMLESHLRMAGFEPVAIHRQLAIPMAIHRAVGRAALSRRLEGVLEACGVTHLIGSPALLLAKRSEITGTR
jgi:ubiquinone/menaquinone biosynthesis C-methylase UbiE